ncbi:MAG: M20/M25/M40 family metallo-hydrolase [Armatimonadetes bacterium]|nr:M20/M25/M40 family metallo-hydrolase [Armatimonadota bacterium]
MNQDASDLLAAMRAHCTAHNEAHDDDHITLSEIPAPAYDEGRRGDHLALRFAQLGLEAIERTPVGNLLARVGAAHDGPRIVVSAHLDTVFAPDTKLTVRRDGQLLHGPGIGDDASGLALMLALAQAWLAVGVEVPGELWLVATVGEESVGNLRGARELAEQGIAGRPIDAFITLDSAVPGQIIRHGTHSRNHLITLSGPGGHAWGEYGVVNPNLVMAQIVAKVAGYRPPRMPRTTLNCGLLHGGFAPNAIPERTEGHLNLRSECGAEMARLDAFARAAVAEAVREANDRRTHGPELRADVQITARHGGQTPPESPLVQAAVAAARRQGWAISHPYSSTDANAFMPAGIPAVCLYRGDGGGEHTLEEWYNKSTRPVAVEALAETILGWFERLTQDDATR